jgi:hypothetical protein
MVAKQADLASVAQIPNLRSLVVDDAAAGDVLHVPTIKPLACAVALEELQLLSTTIDDGDLRPLADLPNLRKVRLGPFIGGDVAQLRAARPDMEIQHTPPDPKWQALKEIVGAVTILKPGEGLDQWSIFQSFAHLLNLQTNYDAERRIKNELRKTNAALAKRLEWDTEGDAVGIYAKSEADIRQVAAILNELIGNTSD